MVVEAKTDTPDLGLDVQTQNGFVKWFNSLEQVGHHTKQWHAADLSTHVL